MIGAVINIFGDMLLMFGLKLGIAGAGISTAVSQLISFSILLSMFLRRKTQTRISVKYVARDFKTVWNVMATGFPSLLRQALNSVATMLLNRAAGVYGDEAVALVQQLRDDPKVIELGIRALRLMCVGQLFVPLTMMVEMGFQSIGESLLASFGSCLRSGLLFIPTLVVLKNIRGISGVQEAQPLSFVFTFIVCLFLCRIYLKRVRE